MIDYLVTQIFLGILLLLAFFGLRSAPPMARLMSCLVGLLLWCFPMHLVKLPVRSMDPIATSRAWLVEVVAGGVPSETAAATLSTHDLLFWLMVLSCFLGILWFLWDMARSMWTVKNLERKSVALPIDEKRFDFLTGGPVRIRMIQGAFDACVTGVFRPTIWVGQCHVDSDHFPSLLFHEWVHLKNRDGLWHVTIHLLQRLFWWNPFCQFFGRQAKAHLELRCDGVCRKQLSEDVYGVHLAQALLVHSGLATTTNQLALGYTRSKNLDVKRILYLRRSFQMKSIHVLLILMVALVGLGVTAGRPLLNDGGNDSVVFLKMTDGDPGQEEETTAAEKVFRLKDEGVNPPEFTKRVDPVFPEEAKKNQLRTDVVIEAIAGSDGKWRDIYVVKVVGAEDAGFQKAAKDALVQWEFKPATVEGKPVSVAITLKIEFSLK